MEKRHFVAIAKVFVLTCPSRYTYSIDSEVFSQWETDIRYMADYPATTNPRFGRVRFIKACNE